MAGEAVRGGETIERGAITAGSIVVPLRSPTVARTGANLVPSSALRWAVSSTDSRTSFFVAISIALAAHLAAIAALVTVREGVGAGGSEDGAINIEIVDSRVLEVISARRVEPSAAAAAADLVAATDGAAASVASDSGRPGSEQNLEPPKSGPPKSGPPKYGPPDVDAPLADTKLEAPAVLAVPTADWAVERLPSLHVIQPEADPEKRAPRVMAIDAGKPGEFEAPLASPTLAAPAGGATASGRDVPATPSPSATAAAASPGEINRFVGAVRAALAKTKPKGTGRSGTTLVTFAIAADGALDFVRIQSSSGSAPLDQTALDAVRRAAPFKTPPPGLPKAALAFSVPYRFE